MGSLSLVESRSKATSCEGKSIPEIIEEEILASCGSGDASESAANELVESLEGETWIDLEWLEEGSRLRCIVEEYIGSNADFFVLLLLLDLMEVLSLILDLLSKIYLVQHMELLQTKLISLIHII